ncbi:uncharacterized protein LOC120661392 [Panicum virgatum]|uniref:MADS-box domain-containing protein n=1 Tax=Panicum virgatum TaxID=38727 RepID=A0A8T0W957_PANVG|nr:uncharacterized protein LOC120661392 [Panicum virgatum]KAG2639789.1 hypothetical protein PVAP13_2KG045600 [Panicum virgatum]
MTRPRRTGISYVENDSDRSVTFFKRRSGLYKAAADLSTLTGARIAIALESEIGKMSSFGTPSAGPIIDSFLSGNILVDPSANEEQKVEITHMQNEVFVVEREKYMEDRRKQETSARAKEIQETSRKAKLVYGKVEDLSVQELNEMVCDLSQIKQEINDGCRPQQPSYQLEVGQLSSSSSLSQIQMPPRRLPWTPRQPSFHLPRSSWSRPQPSSLMPQHPLVVEPQVQMMLSPIETYQNNYNTQPGIHINGNIPQPFSQSFLVSALPPPPPPPPSSSAQITFCNEFPPPSSSHELPTPLPKQTELHPTKQYENHASAQDITIDHSFVNYQWPSPIPFNEPYYDISLYGMNLNLGGHGDYGGQAAGEHDMPGPSGLHQHGYDCPYMNFLGSFSSGECPADYSAGNNLGDMGPLGDS